MGRPIPLLAMLLSCSSMFFSPAPAWAGDDSFFAKCKAFLFPSLRVPTQVVYVIREVNIGDEVRITTRRGAMSEGIVRSNGFEVLFLDDGAIPQRDIVTIEVLVHHIPTDGDPQSQQHQQALLESRRQFVSLEEQDHMAEIAGNVATEIRALRQIPLKEERQNQLRATGRQIMAAITAQTGASNIGFHFNLNGGAARQYVDAGGIYAARGADVAVAYGMGGAHNERIYFFDSNHIGLYDMLSETNPKIVYGGRMGNVVNIFSLDSSAISDATASEAISRRTAIFFDYNAEALALMPWNKGRESRFIGIPSSAYIAPPLELFTDTSALGVGRLSRDEETLVAMRYIERALTHQAP